MDLLALFTVNVAHADVDSFVRSVNSNIINPLIIFLFTLAVLIFLYGVLKFLLNSENEEAKTEGKQHMLWGVVGFVIMIGVFALLNMLMRTFNIDGINLEEGTVELPRLE